MTTRNALINLYCIRFNDAPFVYVWLRSLKRAGGGKADGRRNRFFDLTVLNHSTMPTAFYCWVIITVRGRQLFFLRNLSPVKCLISQRQFNKFYELQIK